MFPLISDATYIFLFVLGKLQMGRIGEELDIDFVVSTGDNFYDDGLTGVHDPNFEESFSNIYTAKSLQKPWYNGRKCCST